MSEEKQEEKKEETIEKKVEKIIDGDTGKTLPEKRRDVVKEIRARSLPDEEESEEDSDMSSGEFRNPLGIFLIVVGVGILGIIGYLFFRQRKD